MASRKIPVKLSYGSNIVPDKREQASPMPSISTQSPSKKVKISLDSPLTSSTRLPSQSDLPQSVSSKWSSSAQKNISQLKVEDQTSSFATQLTSPKNSPNFRISPFSNSSTSSTKRLNTSLQGLNGNILTKGFPETPKTKISKNSQFVIPSPLKERNPLPSKFSDKSHLGPFQVLKRGKSTYSEGSELPYFMGDLLQNSLGIYHETAHTSHLETSLEALRKLANDRAVKTPAFGNYQKDPSKRLILALDLDETLIHCCNFDPEEERAAQHSIFYRSGEGVGITAKINIRPHAQQFLARMSRKFELVIFTAAEREYARAMCDFLDPDFKYIKKVFHREHCVHTTKRFVVKDLRVISEKEASSIFLVDNSSHCFAPQIEQGIPILSYKTGAEDTELLKLEKYLEKLCKEEDPIAHNSDHFKLKSYSEHVSSRELFNFLHSDYGKRRLVN